MMNPAARSLFVVGKGGVGRSTVALILARRFAARDERVLFVGLEQSDADLAFARSMLPDAVQTLAIRGEASLAEYLSRRLPAGLHERVVHHEIYARFVAMAPGLKELMALGQVCDLEREHQGGRHRFDRIVVDAPPSGQTIEAMRMPFVAEETAAGALVRFEVRRMRRGLMDPRRTQIVPVTLLEETPVQETQELVERLQGGLGLPIALVVANRIRSCPLSSDTLARARENAPPSTHAVLELARVEAAWGELHAKWLGRLRGEVSVPIVELPEWSAEAFGAQELDALGSSGFDDDGGEAC